MPDTLVHQNENGDVINDIQFKRTVRGIPSLVTKFYLKNESETVSFSGRLNVVPSEGRSYSEDLSISDSGTFWVKNVDFDLSPLERKEFRLRVLPMATPSGISGRSAITITGSWI